MSKEQKQDYEIIKTTDKDGKVIAVEIVYK